MTVLPVADRRRTWSAVARLLRARRGRLAATLLLLLAGTAAGVAVPPLLGALVDAVTARAGGAAVALVGAVAVAGLLAAAVQYAGGRSLVVLVQELLAELREQVFAAAVALPVERLEEAGTGDVVSRVTRDVEAVTEASADTVPRVLTATFAIALTLAGLAVLDGWFALAVLACLPLHVWGTRRFLRRSGPVYAQLRRSEAARGQLVLEAVRGADGIRAHRSQGGWQRAVDAVGFGTVDLQRIATRLRTGFFGVLNTAEYVGLALILLVGFVLVGDPASGVTLGAATAAALYFLRLFDPVGALLISLDDLQRAGVGLARMVGVLDAGAPGAPGPVPAAPGREPPGIRIEGVGFGYEPDRPVLHDVDVELPAGRRLAVVGASGSGKSTLARLVAGALRPDRGRVLVGGEPADRAHRPPTVLLVTQEVHLFSGTLAQNLTLARPGATDAEMTAALAAVGGQDLLELPGGLAADVGPAGAALDATAAQRIAHGRHADLLAADGPYARSWRAAGGMALTPRPAP